MGPMKHGGLALATSLSSIFNAAVMVHLLKKRLGRLGGKKIVRSLVKLVLAAAVMALAVYGFNGYFFDAEAAFLYRLTILSGDLVLGILTFYVISRLSKNEELNFLIQLVRERKSPSSA